MVASGPTAGDLPKGSRVAVVGTGSIGMRHLEVLQGMDKGLPIAVPKRQERIAQLEGKGYCTARGLDEAVDRGAGLCVIATDTGSHVEDGLAALDRGLSVLMEKPMAADTEGAVLLQRRAIKGGLHLFVACVFRFSDSLALFQDLLAEVGAVHSVRIECQSYLPDWPTGRPYLETFRARAGEGGVLLDLIHEVDYAGWIFGWPDSIQARVRNLGILGIDADEDAELFWETASGCAVSVKLDFLSRPGHRRMTAYGKWGIIEWNAIRGTVTLNVEGCQAREATAKQLRNDLFAVQAGAFIDAVAGNADPRLANGEDGVRAVAVCDAARRASQAKVETRVEYR